MRNVWLIVKREYLERVRTRAFILSTVLMPLFVGVVAVLPSKLMTMKSGAERHIILAAPTVQLAEEIQLQLENPDVPANKNSQADENTAPKFKVEAVQATDEVLRNQLTTDVAHGKIDGFVWLTDKAIADNKFVYVTKHPSDFTDFSTVQTAVNRSLLHSRIAARGIPPDQIEDVLKRLDMDVTSVDKSGKEGSPVGVAAFLLPIVLMFIIYMTVLIYGMAVMRSVLQEKTSRVMEVMLSAVTSTQMMAGKLIGVGAVGITQILIWLATIVLFSSPALAAAQPFMKGLSIQPAVLVYLAVFFLLGYFLYSTMYAAVGAMVNSDEEAQQLQWPVILPLMLCAVFATAVIRDPNTPLAFWTSIFPFTAPIIMFVRVAVQMPPVWQILLSIILQLLAIWVMIWICARIYRVGILMYGKRPTLPEILKWIRYA
jgi:ABC-2 type transport system permease protein